VTWGLGCKQYGADGGRKRGDQAGSEVGDSVCAGKKVTTPFVHSQSGFAGTMISFSSWKGWDLHTFGALFRICRGEVLEMVLTESKCTVPESKDQ
jgi:hypothetical protein